MIGPEQHRAVHLAGEADAPEPRHRLGVGRAQVGDHAAGGDDPVARILLGPAGARMVDLVAALGHAEDGAALVRQNAAQARGAEVEP